MIDEGTAFHEAGHAVIRHALGRACIYISAVSTDDFEGVAGGRVLPVSLGWSGRPIVKQSYNRRERVALEDAVVIALAGAIAEARHLGRARPVAREPDGPELGSLSTDMRSALGFTRELTRNDADFSALPNLLSELDQRAAALVDDHWSIIEAVAQELLRRGEMNGREFEGVLRDAIPDA